MVLVCLLYRTTLTTKRTEQMAPLENLLATDPRIPLDRKNSSLFSNGGSKVFFFDKEDPRFIIVYE